jgi:hypothetical protein
MGHSGRHCQRGLVDNPAVPSATADSRSIPYRFEEAVPGIVYDPVRNDIFTALRDGGATFNSRAVAVSTNHQLRSSLLATQAQSDDERPSAARRVQPTARWTFWRRTGTCTMICWLSSTKAEARVTTARGRRRCLVCRCFTPRKRRAGILPVAIAPGVSRWRFGKIYPRTLAF